MKEIIASAGVTQLLAGDQECFSHHIATLRCEGDTTVLLWRNPKSRLYLIEYRLLPQGVLVVTGDCGAAIYTWYRALTFAAIATFHLNYFAEKCEASEAGLNYREWDAQQAQGNLLAEITANLSDTTEQAKEEWRISPDARMVRCLLREQRFAECDSHEALCEWLQTEEAEELLGEDAWEYASCGWRPHARCQLHLEGLKAAWAQWQAIGGSYE
jgi:hypothetical protein